jgi:hypothetical protein
MRRAEAEAELAEERRKADITTSYTYNSFAEPLTVTDPRENV